MDMAIFLRLLFAHVLADFVFQNDKICDGKQGKTKMKYVYQLLHSSIHALMAYLFVADWSNWIVPLVIFISHTLMDYIKVEYMKKDAVSFIIDQFVHIAVIVTAHYYVTTLRVESAAFTCGPGVINARRTVSIGFEVGGH